MSTAVRNDGSRECFATFIGRLIAGTVGDIEWQRFVVMHYHDTVLEDVRRNVAQLAIDRGGSVQWSDAEIAKLNDWSSLLKGSDPA